MTVKKFIKTNFDLCTGCNICQLACSMAKEGGYNPLKARLEIEMKNENLYHQPVVCNHCENPYCMNVCPAGAIYKDKYGYVLIDQNLCIGCKLCVQWCPLGMCKFDESLKKAYKCDFCFGDPECVKACPTNALEIAEVKKEEL
jgi:Fe-S-cluster-containing dehydrogenase component